MRLIILSILLFNISCNKSIGFTEKSDIYNLVYAEKTDKFPRNASEVNGVYKVEYVVKKYAVNNTPINIGLKVENKIIEKLGKDYIEINYDLNSFNKIFKSEKLVKKPNLNRENKAELDLVGTISFSNIYLAKNKQKAVLIMNTFREKLDSSSLLFELEKVNDKWILINKQIMNYS